MNSHSIIIDGDVFAELQRLATPLVDDANSVLRRVLGLPSPVRRIHADTVADGTQRADRDEPRDAGVAQFHARKIQRDDKLPIAPVPEPIVASIPRGSRLPQAEYEVPILEALIELGGSAPSSRVVELTGSKLRDRLTRVDWTRVKSGETRWENRVRFARLMLKKLGQVADDSPHGTWEITDAGRARVAERRRPGKS